MMRRSKVQVLEELPPRTEITLQVKDTTTLVHPEFASEQLADKFSWQVIVPPTQLFFLPFLAR